MKAKLMPLSGKYYGTKIEITDDRGRKHEISLWDNGDYVPSERELEGVCTVEDWINNAWLPNETNYEGGKGMRAKDAFGVTDSHFESRETYDLARKIVAILNSPREGLANAASN